MKNSKYLFYLFILGQSVVYGFGNPMTKVAYESITPLWMLATRFSLAFVLMMMLFGKRIVSALKNHKIRLWLPSALCCCGAYISCNIALNLTSATNVGFIMSLPVIFAPLLAKIFLHGRYEFKRLPVQLAAIAGLFLLCCNGGFFSFGLGEGLALFEALCLAGFLVFGEKAMEEMDVMALTSLQVGLTAVVSVISAMFFDDFAVLGQVTATGWAIIAYLAITCTIVAYILQNVALRHLSSSTVSMLQCTQPILTAVASYILLGETLSGLGLAGAVIIVLCLIGDSVIASKNEDGVLQS